MSSIRWTKPGGKEFGRRPYVTPKKEYNTSMLMITDKAVYDLTIVKQSEFKKPYLTDDYPAMEYEWPPGPPWNPPPYPPPFPPGPPVDPPIIITKVFTCGYNLCYCKGQKKCGSINCTYPITNVSVTQFDVGDGTMSKNGGRICITAASDASGEIEFLVTMKATDRGAGNQKITTTGYYEGHISECPEDECGQNCGGESIGFTSQVMACSTSQNFSVVNPHVGGVYTWEVSGGGSITGQGVYTAPATNADCASNAVIHLLCEGATVATLAITINCYSGNEVAYNAQGACHNFVCTIEQTGNCQGATWYHTMTCAYYDYWQAFKCDGTLLGDNIWEATCRGGGSALVCKGYDATWCDTYAHPTCQGWGWDTCQAECAAIDKRSAAMKAAGCCPAKLLI